MSDSELALPGIDEIRQANRLFLGYLRSRPRVAIEHFGLPESAVRLLKRASQEQIDQVAAFPRALFRLVVPVPGAIREAISLSDESGLCILQVALLLNAWTLSRQSGYSARLLLRLDDDSIRQLRDAQMSELLELSHVGEVVRAAYDDLGWIWQQLLIESRPERRRRLLLLGLQPEFASRALPVVA